MVYIYDNILELTAVFLIHIYIILIMFLPSLYFGANSNWKQTIILNSNKTTFSDYCVSSSMCTLRVKTLLVSSDDAAAHVSQIWELYNMLGK